MTNSSYGNFDYELCVKILNLLKVNIKNILGRSLICRPSVFFTLLIILSS